MTVKEIIDEARKSVGWTQRTLASACGYGSQEAVAMAMGRKNGMRTDTFIRLLDAMGYEVVVQSKNPNVNKNKWVAEIGGESK